MDVYRKLCFFLFFPLSFGGSDVFLEKQIGTEEDLTSLCTNDVILAIHCSIKKEEKAHVTCSLLYIPGQINETQCGSKISLFTQNHTVYLRLMDLTPADRGVYNCECTVKGDVSKVQLKVSVKVNEQDRSEVTQNSYANVILLCSVVIALVIIFGVVPGCTYWMYCRQRSEPAMTGGEEMETFTPLQQPTSDLYQTIHTFKQ